MGPSNCGEPEIMPPECSQTTSGRRLATPTGVVTRTRMFASPNLRVVTETFGPDQRGTRNIKRHKGSVESV